jgi:hypothetical protein
VIVVTAAAKVEEAPCGLSPGNGWMVQMDARCEEGEEGFIHVSGSWNRTPGMATRVPPGIASIMEQRNTLRNGWKDGRPRAKDKTLRGTVLHANRISISIDYMDARHK